MARAPDGATLAYPPEWKTVAGDRGSLSAALRNSAGGYIGYLNLTPRQGDERQSNWTTFRIRHNEAEGNRHVRVIAGARTLHFVSLSAACVQDAYTTSTGTRYVEVACLLGGRRPSVVVAAAPPARWRLQAPTLERAISAAAAGIGVDGPRTCLEAGTNRFGHPLASGLRHRKDL